MRLKLDKANTLAWTLELNTNMDFRACPFRVAPLRLVEISESQTDLSPYKIISTLACRSANSMAARMNSCAKILMPPPSCGNLPRYAPILIGLCCDNADINNDP